MEKIAYTINEAADALSMSRSNLYKIMRSDPTFPFTQIGGKRLIPVARLQEWLEAQCDGAKPA